MEGDAGAEFFQRIIHRVLDPSTDTETLFTLVALAALAVAAMAIYAMMMAVKIWIGGMDRLFKRPFLWPEL
jgi:hypothetical protein